MYLGSNRQSTSVFGEVRYHMIVAFAQEYACRAVIYKTGDDVVS